MNTLATKATAMRKASGRWLSQLSPTLRTLAKKNRLPIHIPQNATCTRTAHTKWILELPTQRAHPSGSFQIGAYHRNLPDSVCITPLLRSCEKIDFVKNNSSFS